MQLDASGCEQARVRHRPQLPSDNGPSYLDSDLAEWVTVFASDTSAARLATQAYGKIGRWYQALKNRILLGNYYLPAELGAQVAAFLKRYNGKRDQKSLNSLTAAAV